MNFQSWLDPFIIITALPGALAGILWMLLLTHTTLSVPSLTGTIMCMGVATANSILMVSFARERMHEGLNSTEAALEAGYVRMRPVLMTAMAMIIGMVPMSLGLGEGGEQNAPLGRAVIGGLIVATFATLFFVPCVFSMVHRTQRRARPSATLARATRSLAEDRCGYVERTSGAELIEANSANGRSAQRRSAAATPEHDPHAAAAAACSAGFWFVPRFPGARRSTVLLQRRTEHHVLAEQTDRMAVPYVAVIHATPLSGDSELVLPGNINSYVDSPIYARTNGYLKKWYKDIGSHVAKGDLLADIDTPEVDAQLAQAKADLATAQANVKLAGITAARYQDLLKSDSVSKQEVDNFNGDYAAKQAMVQSAAGEREAPGGTGILQARLRAVCRRHHRSATWISAR